jgi:Secretion system C-terminal sorting domain
MTGYLLSIKMNPRFLASGLMIIILNIPIIGQAPQGFFLDSWQPRSISDPSFIDIPQVSGPVTVSVKIDFNDTITKIPGYVFGNNANVYTGCMSDNKELMKNIANLNIGVLRGPSGSISDVFFWNRNVNKPPDDVPPSMLADLWYGDRPYSWENWTMAVDSFYSVLGKVNATGMLTVNYGYARYGTGTTPVANAAHMAAEWVRYDKGRTKFWEIGNEVSGSWEAGYRIDPALNKDGQPEYINGTIYGKHSLVFIDSMKAAAKETGADIKIGLVMCEEYSSANAAWNKDVAAQAGDKADFYVVHSYFTPYNQNSDVETILSSPAKTASYKTYVWGELDKAGKPHLPVALTEYNIFAAGSEQAVSQVNGMHAILVINEVVKNGFGAALRWDLANGWNNGDDHGMFSSGNEPGIEQYSPRPVFFDLYYFQKYTGDILLNSSVKGDSKIVVIPTAFSSGQAGTVIVNTGRTPQITRLNLVNFRYGNRYYTYTLTGTPSADFSRKVFINGMGNNLDAGGPDNYERIIANSSLISDEIRIKAPPLSVTFVLIQPGNKELAVNDSIVGLNDLRETDKIRIWPNPASGQFTVSDIPAGISVIEIISLSGEIIYRDEITGDRFQSKISRSNLVCGVYILRLKGNGMNIVKKLIVI